MNYKKLQIVPIKRRYLRISETENQYRITVFTVKSSFSSLFMDLRALVNSRHLVKKGSVETVHARRIVLSNALGGYGTNCS